MKINQAHQTTGFDDTRVAESDGKYNTYMGRVRIVVDTHRHVSNLHGRPDNANWLEDQVSKNVHLGTDFPRRILYQ